MTSVPNYHLFKFLNLQTAFVSSLLRIPDDFPMLGSVLGFHRPMEEAEG